MKKEQGRDNEGKCLKCGDTTRTSDGGCYYCNWKGDTGLGLTLKKVIKDNNENIPRIT